MSAMAEARVKILCTVRLYSVLSVMLLVIY